MDGEKFKIKVESFVSVDAKKQDDQAAHNIVIICWL